jgi:hypothetical protein
MDWKKDEELLKQAIFAYSWVFGGGRSNHLFRTIFVRVGCFAYLGSLTVAVVCYLFSRWVSPRGGLLLDVRFVAKVLAVDDVYDSEGFTGDAIKHRNWAMVWERLAEKGLIELVNKQTWVRSTGQIRIMRYLRPTEEGWNVYRTLIRDLDRAQKKDQQLNIEVLFDISPYAFTMRDYGSRFIPSPLNKKKS